MEHMGRATDDRSLVSAAGRSPVGFFPDATIGIFLMPPIPRTLLTGGKNEEFVARDRAARSVFWIGTLRMTDPIFDKKSTAAKAHDALITRLAQLDRRPVRVRPPKSLQPTPEAAKSRVRRLRKKRLLLQRSMRTMPLRVD
jgi:hypothetical protein